MPTFVVEVEDLVKTFDSFIAVDHIRFQVEKGRDLRISGSKWGRQVHDHPNALRASAAHFGKGEGCRIRYHDGAGEDQAGDRVYVPEIFTLR